MSRTALLVVVLFVSASVFYPVAQACGDKFLMVGRGVKFQRAYASVYPGKLIIYAQPSTDPKASIRDPQFHKALRQAGHAVSVIEDWTLLEQALRTISADVILVDVAEAERLQGALSSSTTHPDALYVAFPSIARAPATKQFICKVKSSDRPMRYLDAIEDLMKARAHRPKSS